MGSIVTQINLLNGGSHRVEVPISSTSTSEAVVKMKLESMLVLNDYLTTHHQMDTADDVDLQEEAVEDKDSEKNMGKKRKKYLATAK